MNGWIKSYRSTIEKGWYKKPGYFHLWHHLLYKATHSEMETWFSGKSIVLKPGQFITGRKKLSLETGINESKIERILTYFEKIEQQIEQQKTSTSRLITIVNWKLYQCPEQQIEQRVNNGRTTSEQRVNTIQEDKEDKRKKRNIYSDKKFIPPSQDEVIKYFQEWGYKKGAAIQAWNYYEAGKWKDSRGNKIKNWKQKMHGVWFRPENESPKRTTNLAI